MKTERDKMLAGEPYDPGDADLRAGRARARSLCQRFNALPAADAMGRAQLLGELFGQLPDKLEITAPFFCDYGSNIELGRSVYFNTNCVILDVAPVRIGDNTLFGPGVQIYTALHPLSAAERRGGLESGKPVCIEADVWVGGGAIICPGVTVGAGSVIGAGSVVTKSVPAGVLAAGNPCRVVRSLA